MNSSTCSGHQQRNSAEASFHPAPYLDGELRPTYIQHTMSPPSEKESLDQLKQNTARLSVISNTGLVLMKFVVGFAIGSVSIISEAIHSSMDLIAAVIAFFSVRKSAEPPDAAHSFGHGKFEDISGLIEALLIFVAAILIIYEAVSSCSAIPRQSCGLKCSSLVSRSWGSRRWRTGTSPTGSLLWQKSRSPLRSRAMPGTCGPMSIPRSGFLPASILIKLTGNPIFDPLFALGVAVVIMKAAYDLTKRSLADLIDHSIPETDEKRIKEIICEHSSIYAGFHDLKTRRSGRRSSSSSTLSCPGISPLSSPTT